MALKYNLLLKVQQTYDILNARINKPTKAIRKGVTLRYTLAIYHMDNPKPTTVPLWMRRFQRKSR